MPIQFSKSAILLLLALLVGCAGNSTIEIAEPVFVELPENVVVEENIYTDEIKKEYAGLIKVLKSGKIKDAEKKFQQFVAAYPKVAGGHLNLALIEYQNENYKESESHVDEAIELSPRNAIAYNLKGKLLRLRGEFKEARLAYSKALLADPEYAPGHLNIAILYDIYLQYLIDARTHYKKYMDLKGKESAKVKFWLQDLEYRIKQAGG